MAGVPSRGRRGSGRRPTSTTPRRSGGSSARLDAALAAVPHRICFAVKANGNLAVLRRAAGPGRRRRHRLAGRAAPRAGGGIRSGGASSSAASARPPESSRPPSRPASATSTSNRSRSWMRLARGGAGRRTGSRSESGSIPMSPPTPIRTFPPARAASSSASPLDQVAPPPPCVRSTTPGLALTGSRCTSAASCSTGARTARRWSSCSQLVAELRAAGVTTLETLDIGGGLGIRYAGRAAGLDPERVRGRRCCPVADARGCRSCSSPGRFLVGNAGRPADRGAVPEALGRAGIRGRGRRMNDLVRPSHYQA